VPAPVKSSVAIVGACSSISVPPLLSVAAEKSDYVYWPMSVSVPRVVPPLLRSDSVPLEPLCCNVT
jgi:hypothetical protein